MGGPGSTGPLVKFTDGFEIPEVPPLRFDVIGHPMGHLPLPVQEMEGGDHSRIQNPGSDGGHSLFLEIQTPQTHRLCQISERFVLPPEFEAQTGKFRHSHISIGCGTRTVFQIRTLFPVWKDLREFGDGCLIKYSRRSSSNHNGMVLNGSIELPSIQASHVKPGASGGGAILRTLLKKHRNPLSFRYLLDLNGVQDGVPDFLGGGFRCCIGDHLQVDALIDKPHLWTIHLNRTSEDVVVGLDQTGKHGFASHIHKTSLGSRQSPHFRIGPQSHDCFPFYSHGLEELSGRVGSAAAVIHGSNLAVDQDHVRIAVCGYQIGKLLSQDRSKTEQKDKQKS